MKNLVRILSFSFAISSVFCASGYDLGNVSLGNGTMGARGGYVINKKSDTTPEIKLSLIPSGSVFAFEGACPEGSKSLDYAGRTVVGEGFLNDGTLSHMYRVGEKGGKQRHRLTVSEMPSHNHNIPTEPDGSGGWGSIRSGPHKPIGNWPSSNQGGGNFHENRMPYLVLNWCLFD
ncbi:hypothetical protein KW882_02170 [Vibrio parahaemolyticus]